MENETRECEESTYKVHHEDNECCIFHIHRPVVSGNFITKLGMVEVWGKAVDEIEEIEWQEEI